MAKDLPKTSSGKVEVSCEKWGEVSLVLNKDVLRTRKSIRGKDGATYCKNCVKRIRIGHPLYYEYKKGARSRDLSFELSLDEFYVLNYQNCHYCDGMNEYVKTSFTGNGIDRVDNIKGYSVSNCVPCCSICNRAKRDMRYEDFLLWIERLRNVKKK